MKEESFEFIDAVRKRPAMYIGSTSTAGINNLIDEIVRYSFYFLKADFLELNFISDTKASLSLKNIRAGLTAREFYYPVEGKDWIDRYIIGALIGLSKSAEVSFLDNEDNELTKFCFDKGRILEYEDIVKKWEPRHIEILFELDDDILTWDKRLLPYSLLERLKTLAFLYQGRTIALSFPAEKEPSRTVFKFDNGLTDLVRIENLSGFGGFDFIIPIDKSFDNFELQAAIGFNEYSVDASYLMSFVNERVTHDEGVHVDSVLDGIISGVTKFIESSEMLDKDIPTHEILRNQIRAAIHVKMKKPHFEGSIRHRLLNPEIKEDIQNLLESIIFDIFNSKKEKATCVVKSMQRETRVAKYR